MIIKEFSTAQLEDNIAPLCLLLKDAVDGGASIGFIAPLNEDEALNYWMRIAPEINGGERIVCVAVEEGEIIGVGQLALETRANGNHRAEVQKLMVHTDWRGQGIGIMLMTALEGAARRIERTLLILDTRGGDPSQYLYEKMGYVRAGEIPGYALSSDGEYDSTVFFYKQLK